MSETDPAENEQLFPKKVGEKLREKRESQGIDLAEIAARTRIPQRHLESIEQSNYSSLPSTTYAMGFAKAYARSIDADEAALARELRAELDENYYREPPRVAQDFSPPTRTPSGGLAIGVAVIAALLLVTVGIIYGTGMFGGQEAPTAPEATIASELGTNENAVAATSAQVPPPTSGGQVTLTATGEVWVRIYDAADTTLLMKTLMPGERYDVPMNADNPMINIGRPDQLDVTINGSQVAPLGSPETAIKDVGISAEALRNRDT